MIDRNELRRLAQAVVGWSNCNKAWLDTSEDVAAAVVGHINEDGNTYPVMTVDCEQYYSGDSLALAKFYASANPATVLELLDEIERLRTQLIEDVAPGAQPAPTAPKSGFDTLPDDYETGDY